MALYAADYILASVRTMVVSADDRAAALDMARRVLIENGLLARPIRVRLASQADIEATIHHEGP